MPMLYGDLSDLRERARSDSSGGEAAAYVPGRDVDASAPDVGDLGGFDFGNFDFGNIDFGGFDFGGSGDGGGFGDSGGGGGAAMAAAEAVETAAEAEAAIEHRQSRRDLRERHLAHQAPLVQPRLEIACVFPAF